MAVEGLGRLLARMELIPQRAIEAARKSLEASADDVVAMMRRLAPKDSGALARSINWTWGDAPAGALVLGSVKGGRGAGRAFATMTITIYAGGNGIGADAFYARFQEFGTRKMAANPFFFPAYRARRKAISAKLTRDVRKAIAKG